MARAMSGPPVTAEPAYAKSDVCDPKAIMAHTAKRTRSHTATCFLVHSTFLCWICTAAAVFTYTDRDAILYALSVGCSQDALDAADLKFTYELHPDGLTVLPTFAVLFGFGAMGSIMDVRSSCFHPCPLSLC
jgi:hypothetical protein